MRKVYIDAGLIYRMPRRRDHGLVTGMGLAAACIAFLVWLATTPAGTRLAVWIAERIIR